MSSQAKLGMSRRTLLTRGATGAAALLGARWLVPGSAPALPLVPYSQRLRVPPVLTGADITIPIKAADVQILPGLPTRMWTFGGSFPGPTIRRPTGTTTNVTFRHELPKAGSLTIHHHGHHNAAIHDGQPMSQLLLPGRSREYTYEHVEEGHPLRGAMRWYHDHSHGRTGKNAWMGLVGLFVLDDPVDANLGLPGRDRELLLVITETTLDAQNQLVDPFVDAPDPGSDDVGMGELVLVNGLPQPYVEIEPTRYRLRVLNASSFNPYNLGFFGGPPIVQIGNESGLWPAPIERYDRVLLGPAERCDLVVDFSGFAGEDLVLTSLEQRPRAGVRSQLKAAPARRADLLQLRVRGTPLASGPPRSSLVPLPAWTAGLPQAPDRILAFDSAMDPAVPGRLAWTINGRTFDEERPVAKPELGSTETWLLVNLTTQSHYVHLHDVDWKVVHRNLDPPNDFEDVLKETFRLDPGDMVLVGAKFTDHLGMYMVHCHMLSHEDHAMMAPFEVVEPGAGDMPADPLAALGKAQADRVRTMLAAQRLTPGQPAPVPATPLQLQPGALDVLCRIDTTEGTR